MDKYLTIPAVINSPLVTYQEQVAALAIPDAGIPITVASATGNEIQATAPISTYLPGVAIMRDVLTSDASVAGFVGASLLGPDRFRLSVPVEHNSLIPPAGSVVRLYAGPLADAYIYNEMPSSVAGDIPSDSVDSSWPCFIITEVDGASSSKVANTAFSGIYETRYEMRMHILAPFHAVLLDSDDNMEDAITDALARHTIWARTALSLMTQQVLFLLQRKGAFANTGQTPKFDESSMSIQYNQRVPIPGMPNQVAYVGNTITATLLYRQRRA